MRWLAPLLVGIILLLAVWQQNQHHRPGIWIERHAAISDVVRRHLPQRIETSTGAYLATSGDPLPAAFPAPEPVLHETRRFIAMGAAFDPLASAPQEILLDVLVVSGETTARSVWPAITALSTGRSVVSSRSVEVPLPSLEEPMATTFFLLEDPEGRQEAVLAAAIVPGSGDNVGYSVEGIDLLSSGRSSSAYRHRRRGGVILIARTTLPPLADRDHVPAALPAVLRGCERIVLATLYDHPAGGSIPVEPSPASGVSDQGPPADPMTPADPTLPADPAVPGDAPSAPVLASDLQPTPPDAEAPDR
jgi:hypothetical protein